MWWKCGSCTAAYAMDAEWCPQCGASDVCTAVVSEEGGYAVRCGVRKCEEHRDQDAAERRKAAEVVGDQAEHVVSVDDGVLLVGDGQGEALPPADDTVKTSKGRRRR